MAANDNPYLALLQQEAKPPGWAEILQHIGNLGFGLAGGFGQAAATGQPTMSAIGPGLMMGNQMNAQAAHQAEQERMKRLELQFKAQEHEDKRAELLRKEKQLQLLAGQYGPSSGTTPGFQVAPPQPSLMGPGGTPDQNAIGGIESGGRYDAVGPSANSKGQRAYGKYQIMDFNIGPWTQEVLGKPMTPQEFLANPQAQDAVFNTKFGQYSQKYGPVGASRAWFAGEGGMNNPNATDVNGMTVQRYGDRFAQSRGVAPAPVGPNGVALPPVAPGGAGPTFSALPAFEGPGMGTVQPGALPEGVQPRVNLPAPAPVPPPPQVAQGDAATPSGARIDPNAQPPQFMQPGGPGPNVVQAQYKPAPDTPPMAPPPVPVLPDRPTLTQADSARLQSLVLGGHPEQAQSEYNRMLTMQRSEVMERHKAEVEVWKQQQEGGRFERGEKAKLAAEERAQTRQLDAEQRRADAEQQRHERTIAEQQKVRADAAKQAGDKQTFEQTKFMTEDENKLRDDFNAAPPVKSYRIVVPMLESAKDAEKRPTRAADLNLVYAFAKLMDPDSVVRESETAGVVATASVADRLSAYIGQLNGQAMLNPDVRAKLMKELDSRFRALEESYKVHENAYAGIADRRGLHRDNIIMPIRGPKPPAEAKPADDGPVYDTSGKRIQ